MRLLASLLLFSLTGCDLVPDCEQEVIQVAREIGSDRYAVVEVRNCGATTGYATIVRIGKASEAQRDATEIFIADTDHGAAMAGQDGSVWLDLKWTAPGELSIVHDPRARVFKQITSANGAIIRFSTNEPIAQSRSKE